MIKLFIFVHYDSAPVIFGRICLLAFMLKTTIVCVPTWVLLGNANDEFANVDADLSRPSHATGFSACLILFNPSLVGAELNNADQILNLMAELATDGQKTVSFFG